MRRFAGWGSGLGHAGGAPPARPSLQTVLVIDDDPVVRAIMTTWLEQAGYRSIECDSASAAMAQDTTEAAAACLDLGLEDASGMEVLGSLLSRDQDLPVIMVTADDELSTAVAAMRAGAYDYLVKPIESGPFLAAVNRATERRYLAGVVERLQHELDEHKILGSSIVGQSASMREVARQLARVASSDVAVCVLGESGTGKELVARALHTLGPRKAEPFVAINCAAIQEALQESELFGHERGAFTGAMLTHRGRFEQANRGTLFLDEIGDMSLATQAALLRTLQERTIRRVGGVTEIPVDVRIVSATNRDLVADVKSGRFRQDLFYRLVVYPIRMPLLAERRDDIPLLVDHFIRKLRADTGSTVVRVHASALEALLGHHWPGNVRELENTIHRAMLACADDEILLSHLPPELAAPNVTHGPGVRAGGTTASEGTVMRLDEVERKAIRTALVQAKGNVSRAAKLLGIGRATLYRKVATLGSDVEDT